MDRTLKTPKVKDILIKNTITFRPHFTSLDAVWCFEKFNITEAPVIDVNNEVIGNITESDCIKCLSQSLFYDESRNRTIDYIISKEKIIAQSEWDIFELEKFFISNNQRTAAVVDTNNHLLGIVTKRETLKALAVSILGRQKYKKEIKTPFDLDFREKVKIILNRYRHAF